MVPSFTFHPLTCTPRRLDTIEGQGSTFHLIASLASHQPDVAATSILAISSKKKLLVIVRNSLLRHLLSEQLLAWGFIVESVGTSTEALQLQRGDYSLLVADINGRPDDANLLQYFQLPVVLLRLGGEEERLKEAKEKSKAILLFKPVRRDEFQRALSRALDRERHGPCLLVVANLLTFFVLVYSILAAQGTALVV